LFDADDNYGAIMDEETVITIIKEYLEGQFPRNCESCGMQFNSLAEYIKNTSMLGDPVSYDMETNEWEPETPLGTYSYANCNCGSTVALTSKGLTRWTILQLMMWVRVESWKRGVTIKELLRHLRMELRRRVLDDSNSD
jgi:hypothetical protein